MCYARLGALALKSQRHTRKRIRIVYDSQIDLLEMRFDDREQDVVNRRAVEDTVLDIGADGRIVGIEIVDASRHLNLERLLPVEFAVSA